MSVSLGQGHLDWRLRSRVSTSSHPLAAQFLTLNRYLLAEKAFSSVKIYEQRAIVGGLWNYICCPKSAPERLSVPQTNPHAGYDEPIWDTKCSEDVRVSHDVDAPVFMSPLYDRLETNIPRGLMGFSDLDWPESCQLFPEHEAVLNYLERYAEDVRDLIEFRKQVLDVQLDNEGRWLVKTQQLSEDTAIESREQVFDAVVVASGHFNVPYIPPVPGIEAWNKAYPGSICHSMFYRRPESYANKKIIVVGNSASGVDIATQISAFCKVPLLQSQKSESFLEPDQSSTKIEKPEIVEYVAADRRVLFADGSVESEVDAVLYCTGYFYSFPFLTSLDPPVVTTGEYVGNLYQHVFYRPHPTLALVALNQKIIPFPVAEAQSAVISRVLSGRLSLPGDTEMYQWEQRTLEETGGGRNFHVLKFPKDADYIGKQIPALQRHQSHLRQTCYTIGPHLLTKRRMDVPSFISVECRTAPPWLAYKERSHSIKA